MSLGAEAERWVVFSFVVEKARDQTVNHVQTPIYTVYFHNSVAILPSLGD